MTRPGGMEDAVEKRNAEQAGHRGVVGFHRAQAAREHAIEFRLFGKDPARHAVCRGRRWRSARADAEGAALRKGRTDEREKKTESEEKADSRERAAPARSLHGHFTAILLAKA